MVCTSRHTNRGPCPEAIMMSAEILVNIRRRRKMGWSFPSHGGVDSDEEGRRGGTLVPVFPKRNKNWVDKFSKR